MIYILLPALDILDRLLALDVLGRHLVADILERLLAPLILEGVLATVPKNLSKQLVKMFVGGLNKKKQL
jgi:hypothetical protein